VRSGLGSRGGYLRRRRIPWLCAEALAVPGYLFVRGMRMCKPVLPPSYQLIDDKGARLFYEEVVMSLMAIELLC
jgi:hypothetical protein